MDKKVLRKRLIEKRKSLDKNAKSHWDKIISDTICNSDYFKSAKQVLIFSSTDDEFDTKHIVKCCKAQAKDVFYPLCLDRDGNMEFFKVSHADDLVLGMYNIFEPKPTCEKYVQKENDLVIVPCLSADRQKNRIGYGKGYYDRFLSEFCGTKVGVCYDFQVLDEIPASEHDVKMDIIITETRIYNDF